MKLAKLRTERRLDFKIEVDGGVSLDTIGDIVRAGAEVLVAGNAVFGKGDARENVQKLLKAASAAMMQKV
jgi:ribulose-phosphate 3-epimerase